MSFSGIGVFKRFRRVQRYHAILYYVRKDVLCWTVDFVILQDLHHHTAVVDSKYDGVATKVGPDQEIAFEEEQITLDIPKGGAMLESGWSIIPCTHPMISKWEVDTFKPGHRVPACQLLLKWGGVQEQPVELMYRINLLGAKEPFNYTLIFLPELHPPLQGHATSSTQPQLKDLIDALYHRVADEWKVIGIQLKIPIEKLAGIETKYLHDPRCLLEMLVVWLEQVHPPATWAAIIEAVEFLGEVQLGRELREKYWPTSFLPGTSDVRLDPSLDLEQPERLGIDTLADTTSYLYPLKKTEVFNLGLVLGLEYNRLKTMRDSPNFLQDTIAGWLQGVDQVLRVGVPTWKRLVEALKDPRVGQNGLTIMIEQHKQDGESGSEDLISKAVSKELAPGITLERTRKLQQLPVTLPQLISFKGRSRNMNLLELIGTHYWEFGILLLDDTVGEATKTIIERHHHDPTKINLEIFQKWILCRGKMPVEWSTLIDVLNSIGLVDLASEMEQTLSAQ